MAALPLSLPRGVSSLQAYEALPKKPALALGWPGFDALLPDGGLPRGVVEIASKHALGGPTRIAARAVAAAHAKGPEAWCAWLDPEGSLHAPGLARAGVDLDRLFVVRPPRAELGRIAVKVARAGAFDVVIVDMDCAQGGSAWPPPYPGTCGPRHHGSNSESTNRIRRPLAPEVVVRKLALAAEEGEATVILLTDATAPRAMPWPVALRLELERRPDAIGVRVAKDHRGRMNLARTWVPLSGGTIAGSPARSARGTPSALRSEGPSPISAAGAEIGDPIRA